MLANVVALVPRIMIDARNNGAILSIFIGALLSSLFFYFYMNILLKFPKKTHAEIVKEYIPKWIAVLYIMIISLIFFISSWLILVVFIDITKRFVNPDLSPFVIGIIFLSVICFGALLKSEKTLYALEIILLFCIPFIGAIFLKSTINQHISWDAIKIVFRHGFELPKLETIGATTYSFLGFYYYSIYNKVIDLKKKKIPILLVFIVAAVGIVNLLTSLLVPIGYHGFDGIEEYVYPWFSTADAIRMELGFIERVLFIFLLLYVGVSIISATISSHVGIETIRYILPQTKWRNVSIFPIFIMIVFSLFTTISYFFISQEQVFELAKIYFTFLLPMGVISIVVLVWADRRKKHG